MPDVCLLNSLCSMNQCCNQKQPCGETGKTSAVKKGEKQHDVNDGTPRSPSVWIIRMPAASSLQQRLNVGQTQLLHCGAHAMREL